MPFNAEEILRIAGQMERNGAAFYREAKGRTDDPAKVELLEELASMEDEHEGVFSSMLEELGKAPANQTVFDPDEDAAKVLGAWADDTVFQVGEVSGSQLEGLERFEDILRFAIEKEKDSVVFYEGVRLAMKDPAHRAVADRIIAEELGHIVLLNVTLSAL
jgi:rubrerythrin